MNQPVSDYVFPQAIIPTISLFQISDMVGDKLDGFVYVLTAHSAERSTKRRDEKHSTYSWLRIKERLTPFLELNYRFKKYMDEPFGIPLAVELASQFGVTECWVMNLTLHVVDDAYGDILYIFKNRPLTVSSQASAFVFNFYKRRRMMHHIRAIPNRHLELVEAKLFHQKGHLDWHITHSDDFISRLSRYTHGLIYLKQIKRTLDNLLVDMEIRRCT